MNQILLIAVNWKVAFSITYCLRRESDKLATNGDNEPIFKSTKSCFITQGNSGNEWKLWGLFCNFFEWCSSGFIPFSVLMKHIFCPKCVINAKKLEVCTFSTFIKCVFYLLCFLTNVFSCQIFTNINDNLADP